MSSELPYVTSCGYITKVFDKIIEAKTPAKFTQDYLKTVLGFASSSARPVIPFMKRVGLLASDSAPTELYRQFRSSLQRGKAAATALREGFKPLFEANEYANNLDDGQLSDLIIQVTGLESGSRSVQAISGSFKAVNSYANFGDEDVESMQNEMNTGEDGLVPTAAIESTPDSLNLGLSYTINLNLPATSDVSVFDAIFRSLRENLLK